jgi:hypothetical protein
MSKYRNQKIGEYSTNLYWLAECGHIIIGYPGVGKSHMRGYKHIDLESSWFHGAGVNTNDDWYISYCTAAMELANQQYIVYVSSHDAVVNYLKSVPLLDHVGGISIVCPTQEMRVDWTQRLFDRYSNSGLEKDKRAYERAYAHYEDDIQALLDSGIPCYHPKQLPYDLLDVVTNQILRA